MMVINAKACYLYKMSAMESQDVHTTHGLHVLEVSTQHIVYIYFTCIYITCIYITWSTTT